MDQTVAGKLSIECKTDMMGRLIIVLWIVGAFACNNDASRNGKSDSASGLADTSQRSGSYQRDIMGGDTIPSPETHADTSK